MHKKYQTKELFCAFWKRKKNLEIFLKKVLTKGRVFDIITKLSRGKPREAASTLKIKQR